MNNNLHTATLQYSQFKTEIKKIGGTAKANRIISTRQRMDRIEEQFFKIAYKFTRAETQRNERSAKRK